MWLLPVLAGLIALAFAGSLARRFVRRRRAYEAVWTLALLMYAIASFVVALGAVNGWTTGAFRVYWAFGAVLNVPYLAQGELDLLIHDRRARSALYVVLGFVTAFVIARVRTAGVDAAALTQDLPSGKEVFGDGSSAHRLPQLVSIPAYVVLVGGAVWSAARMRGRRHLRDRARGTLVIAGGATIIAVAGSAFAALGRLVPFSVSLLVGVTVMYGGFLLASRPSPTPRSAPPGPDPLHR